MHQVRTELIQTFSQIPHTSIPSNEPYAPRKGVVSDGLARKAARLAFLDGQQEWPELEFPQLDVPPLDSSERAYQGVLSELHTDEANGQTSPEAELLYKMTARKLAEVYRHKEAERLRKTVIPEKKEISRERAGAMQEELFGAPETEDYMQILAPDVRNAFEATQSDDSERKRIAEEFLHLLGIDETQARAIIAKEQTTRSYELRDDTMEVIKRDLFTLFPKLRHMERFSDGKTSVEAVHALPAFRTALGAFGLPKKGWKAVVIDGSSSAETTGRKRLITFGKKRKDFTPTAIVGTPVHEAIHALRYQNMKDRPEPILRHAMPGVEAFEEGLPVVIEQILSGVKRVSGEAYLRQIGLQKQLHLPAEKQKNLSTRQLQEILWRRAVLLQKGAVTQEKMVAARAAVYGPAMRTNRGNALDSRDMIYYNGARSAVDFLNETGVYRSK